MGICLTKIFKPKKQQHKSKEQEANDIELQKKIVRLQTYVGTKPSYQMDQDYFFDIDQWYEQKYHYNGELLFSKNQFILLYQNYIELQQNYIKNFSGIYLEPNPEPTHLNSKSLPSNDQILKMRYLVRRGCNVALIRTLIKNKFLLNWDGFVEEYEDVRKAVFENSSSSTVRLVPTFSELKLKELQTCHCLTQNGITSLKRILWVVRDNFPNLEYNPMLVQIAQISLIFFNESETYLLLKTIINDSQYKLDSKKQGNDKIMKDLRWYFTFTNLDYRKKAILFFDIAKNRSQEFASIITFLDTKQFDYLGLFNNWTSFFFLNILKFSTVLRIWTIFMNEGIRIVYKITFGIWMSLDVKLKYQDINDFQQNYYVKKKSSLFSCNTIEEINKLLKQTQIDTTPEKTDQLFITSYRMKIKKLSKFFKDLKAKGERKEEQIIYRPRTTEKSQIMTYSHFEAIWEWIPGQFKISNPSLIFSTIKDGFSFTTLFSRTVMYLQHPMLLIVRSSNKSIFGVFSETMVKPMPEDTIYGTEEIFLFKLTPEEIAYMPTGQDKCYISSTRKVISFGVNALTLKDTLKGSSYMSDTFCNDPLHGITEDNSFDIIDIELYCLSY